MAKKQVKSKDGTTVYIEYVPNVTHKICSLFPKEVFLEERVVVPACLDTTPADKMGEVGGIKYSFTEVLPKASRVFIGGGKNDTWEVRLDVSAYDHARDLIGYTFSDNVEEPSISYRSEAMEGRGLFVPAGEVPTLAELKAAQKKQRAFFEAEAQKAQSYWSQFRRMDNISEVSIIAARALGNKYEWMAGEQHLTKKSEAETLAEALKLLIPALQPQAPAQPAAPAKRN